MDDPFDEITFDERQYILSLLKRKRDDFLKQEQEHADNLHTIYNIRRVRY